MIDAVVFDLDGVLLDSEQVWDEAREQLARERGGRWNERAQRDMMGMSSLEWSRYMHDVIGLAEPPGRSVARSSAGSPASTATSFPSCPKRARRWSGWRPAGRSALPPRPTAS